MTPRSLAILLIVTLIVFFVTRDYATALGCFIVASITRVFIDAFHNSLMERARKDHKSTRKERASQCTVCRLALRSVELASIDEMRIDEEHCAELGFVGGFTQALAYVQGMPLRLCDEHKRTLDHAEASIEKTNS